MRSTLAAGVIAWALLACGKDGGGGGGGGGEAQLQLQTITKNAKRAFVEKAAFPSGSTGLTPAKDCCSSGGTCKPDVSAWSNPAWRALGFELSEPHKFQYSYESDGKTFTAKAVGCGDNARTWSTIGRSEGGNVVVEMN